MRGKRSLRIHVVQVGAAMLDCQRTQRVKMQEIGAFEAKNTLGSLLDRVAMVPSMYIATLSADKSQYELSQTFNPASMRRHAMR